MEDKENNRRSALLGQAFSPSAPVDARDLFAGRQEQLNEVLRAIESKGQHILIFGERGVGKTSLANIFSMGLRGPIAAKTNSDGSDTFSTVWKKVFSQVSKKGERIPEEKRRLVIRGLENTPADLRPDDVRKSLLAASDAYEANIVVIIDEFDRMKASRKERACFADLLKTLSDNADPITVILVGVADSVSELLEEHASIERALRQVPMPRMTESEIGQIVKRGLQKADFTISESALTKIVGLSQGLPHYAHLLGQNSGYVALQHDSAAIEDAEVDVAIEKAVDKVQESTRASYDRATSSPRRESLYSQVLLGCALARPDSRGYFFASAVRKPMSLIMQRPFEIPAFSRHLYDFCEKERGPVLQKIGTARKYRFRFINPMMQPFVIMNGLSKKMITPEQLVEASRRDHP